MRTIVWSLFAIVALLWTGAAWLSHHVVELSVAWSQAGDAPSAAEMLAHWQIPPWVTQVVGVQQLHHLFDMLASGLQLLQDLSPFFADMLGWLIPVIWFTWFVGMVLLLVPTLVLHAVLRPSRTPGPPPTGRGPGPGPSAVPSR